MNDKLNNQYFFNLEGETEQWYFEHLRDLINASKNAKYSVSFKLKTGMNPYNRAKSINNLYKTVIYQISDYESDDDSHKKDFLEIMDNMKKAKELGRKIIYEFGYSNLTFDLWMVLHMIDCNGSKTHRRNYLDSINKAFNENFENMDKYKKEDNFKRCMKKIRLSNVINAVNRAQSIMDTNKNNRYTLHEYKGFTYYKENPSLTIGEIIEKILKDCKLI